MNQITRADRAIIEDAVTQVGQADPSRKIPVGRRGFLTTGTAFGGGLLLTLSWLGGANARSRSGGGKTSGSGTGGTTTSPTTSPTTTAVTTSTVNVFVVIGTDNTITIIAPGGEMGQGINSAHAQTIAEELPLVWSSVKTVPAPYGARYGLPPYGSQVTGGSTGVRNWFNLMLQAGATARELLLAAARAQFPSAPTPLKAVPGAVQDANGVQLATYGQLAPAASLISPTTITATVQSSRGNFKVVGTAVQRPDLRAKVDGSAIFGLDVHPNNTPAMAGMVFAAVRHCPTWGGTVSTVGTAPTGSQVINLGNAIAATGATTWKARQNVSAVSVTWTLPTSTVLATADTTKLAANAQTLMTSGTPVVAEQVGDVTTAMTTAAKTLNLTYSLPFLAHACMEVLNCSVALTKDATGAVTKALVYAPTQAPDWVAATVATLIPSLALTGGGPDPSKITVVTTLMGGGLGRKIEQDYIAQAVQVALAVGKPVKLTWFREEDFGRDWYRPSALSRVQVGLDANGGIVAWANRIVAPSVLGQRGWLAPNTADMIAVGSAVGSAIGSAHPETSVEAIPYASNMPNRLVEYIQQQIGFKVGFWRSVGQSISCFVVESAIDECAAAMGIDPYQYRRQLLAGNTAWLAVLDAAANLAGWSTPPAANHARGIALSPGFGSMQATVAELAIVTTTTTSSTGVVTTTTSYNPVRVCVAVDCGYAVNPDQVTRQIEGGVLHGMNAALWHKVNISNGQVQVHNFDNYAIGRMSTTPQIDVVIVNQGSPLGGMGEVGVPGIAPAIANAYAALSGVRKRSLPLGITTAPKSDD